MITTIQRPICCWRFMDKFVQLPFVIAHPALKLDIAGPGGLW
jgi:hypothetical protein